MPNCIECNNKKGTLRSKLEQVICKDCINLDKYTLIVKTKAKKEYILRDDDLENLENYYGTAAYGSGVATYYVKEQLIQKACEVHNTTPEQLSNVLADILEHKKVQKETKKINGVIKKMSSQNTRTSKLVKALRDAGLELRTDSVLCKKYIQNETEYTLEECVERMCQMKYLFEYCHMADCKSEAYEEHIQELKAGYYPDCSVFDKAEDIALSKYSNGTYPNVYPWQK